jgi:dihydrolipoamide dehydrogenase
MVMGDIQEGLDVVVIGAGPGGYVAAIRAAQLGRDVTLIDERVALGGVCLSEGCIPSKALIHASNLYDQIAHAEIYGIKVEGASCDLGEMQRWKEGIIQKLTQGVQQLCQSNKVTILQGTAQFTTKNSLQVTHDDSIKSFQFKNAIIATGARSVEIPSIPFSEQVLSSKEALELTSLPKKLAIIGGGYIGVELGTVYAKLGSTVTIIEAEKRLLPELDKGLGRPVIKQLKALGVTLLTGVKAKEFKGGQLTLEGAENLVVDKVLVAVGRSPNTHNLNLKAAHVQIDERGFIAVNEQCQTSSSKIYAIGDCAGGMLLAHKASAEGKVAAEALCGESIAFDALVPAVIFSDPEIAFVGLSETEAKERGLDTVSSRFPLAAIGRSLASNASEGFVKLIADAKTSRLLGFQMVGHGASELVAEATLAIEMGAHAEDLSLTIHSHPTFSEAIHDAAEGLYGQSIHLASRASR